MESRTHILSAKVWNSLQMEVKRSKHLSLRETLYILSMDEVKSDDGSETVRFRGP